MVACSRISRVEAAGHRERQKGQHQWQRSTEGTERKADSSIFSFCFQRQQRAADKGSRKGVLVLEGAGKGIGPGNRESDAGKEAAAGGGPNELPCTSIVQYG